MTTPVERMGTARARWTGGALREEEAGGTPSAGHGGVADAMGGGVRELLTAMQPELARAACDDVRPPPGAPRARAPDALQCLRCQLLGRRRLTCSRRDLCLEVPQVHPLGSILLLAWLVTAAAFVVSLW